MKFFLNFIILFISGALLPLAFAPFSFYPLAVLSPLILYIYLNKLKTSQAFLGGLIYGLGFFGFGAYWIYISISTYGNTNFIISSIITGGFIVILSLFPASMSYIYKKYFYFNKGRGMASSLPPTNEDLRRSEVMPRPAKNLCLEFASLWVLFEWIRSWFLTGFPWLLLGQSQINSPLQGYAPILGVYGVSFLVIISSGLIYSIFKNPKKTSNILLLIILWFSGYILSYVQWTTPSPELVKTTLIQGNIEQSIKWNPEQAYVSLEKYENLTREHLDSQLIIWPETAITFLYPDAQVLFNKFEKTIQKNHVSILSGIPIPLDNKYYNGAIVLNPENNLTHNFYLKRHLVPFGEYVPLENLLRGIIGFFNLPMSDFSNGPKHQQPLIINNNIIISPFICYEVAYANLLRANLPRANLLVTLSNDAWFDGSEALVQHRQIAQMAAQMTQRYMLVATNSGQTVIINPKGKVVSQAPSNQTTAITSFIQTYSGSTPWIIWGNWPILILIFLIILYYFLQRKFL